MPEALMSAIVNYAASAYKNEVQYAQDKTTRCWQFTSEGSTYATKVKENLKLVYRVIIFPMSLCTDEAFKKLLNCAWDAFVRKSLGLWKYMVGWTAGNAQSHLEWTDKCKKVVANIVVVYKKTFDQAWVTANALKDELTNQGYQPAASYKQILQPFLVTLIGNGDNVEKKAGFFAQAVNLVVPTLSKVPSLQLLMMVCGHDEIGCGYRDLDNDLVAFKEKAKNMH